MRIPPTFPSPERYDALSASIRERIKQSDHRSIVEQVTAQLELHEMFGSLNRNTAIY